MQTRVLVADSSSFFRSGVRAALEDAGFAVDVASDEQDLLAGLGAQPDAVLLDLHLRPYGAAATLERIGSDLAARVIVWAVRPEPEQVLRTLSAGAHGFLTKDMEGPAVVHEIRRALEGETPIHRRLLGGLVDAFQRVERRDRYSDRAIRLSSREREVLALVASGTRNRDIATLLQISEFTVKRHVQNILHKLNVPSREGAADVYHAVFAADESHVLPVPV